MPASHRPPGPDPNAAAIFVSYSGGGSRVPKGISADWESGLSAASLGEEHGWSSVLMAPGGFVDLKVASIQDSLEDLDNRWVMWVHPDHDVTAQVLAILAEEG